MAYRADVAHIEDMDPVHVGLAATEYARVVRLIDSMMEPLVALPASLEWQSGARDLYVQRLDEAIDLVQALRAGYDRAAQAVADYTAAQTTAKDHVATGISAEGSLYALMVGAGVTSLFTLGATIDPLLLWEAAAHNPGFGNPAWAAAMREVVAPIEADGDAYYRTAIGSYEQAITVEGDARTIAADELTAAYEALPSFRTGSWLDQVLGPDPAAVIIAGTPGLREEAAQAAADPNARRPGLDVIGAYQVVGEPDRVRYPDDWYGPLIDGLPGLGHVPGMPPIPEIHREQVQASEAGVLDELSLSELYTFRNIRDEAEQVAGERFPTAGPPVIAGEPNRADNHLDAFRHTYWNARMTQEFGADWTERFATAHETLPITPPATETMDMYNNNLGRSIALANPDASAEELATLVEAAVNDGRATVIGPDGNLYYSDQLPHDGTGHEAAGTAPVPGRIPIPGS